MLILASDWLPTGKDRHVFNVWHHQRDTFNVWCHWWRHNGDRNRASCNATIVTRCLCITALVLLAMWLISISDPCFEIWIKFNLSDTLKHAPAFHSCLIKNMNISVMIKKNNSRSERSKLLPVIVWETVISFRLGDVLQLWKSHMGWRHCSIIRLQRDSCLHVKFVPSLGSCTRHVLARRLVPGSPYLRLN